ncbi:MAG: phage holin family protein [Bacillota bacterium]
MLGLIVRFIISALVLLVLGFILPGFDIAGFGNAILAAIAIAVIGWLLAQVFGRRVSPQSRGLMGFIAAAVVIYFAQFIVPAMQVTVLGAILAAVAIGIADAFVPTELR